MTSRHATFTAAIAAVLSLAAADVVSAQPPPAQPDEVARAERAMNALQQALLTRLRAALEQGGPAAAVSVCHEEAVAIASRVARDEGIALGRTSHRLRNPSNAPRAWAQKAVEQAAGSKAADARVHVIDLGDRVGVLRPIGTADMCLSCHGAPDLVRQRMGPALAATYPGDRATGFAVGDLRGWMWAEVPKAK
jgi:hypothetical protein